MIWSVWGAIKFVLALRPWSNNLSAFSLRCLPYATHDIPNHCLLNNFPINYQCKIQSAKGLALLRKKAHQDDLKQYVTSIWKFHVGFPLLWINPVDDLTLTYELWGIIWIVLVSRFSWQCQKLHIRLVYLIWRLRHWNKVPYSNRISPRLTQFGPLPWQA